jgi:putative radical SAM enzyme (TIGR03279 family)
MARRRGLVIVGLNDPALLGLPEDALAVGDEILQVSHKRTEDALDFHFHAAAEGPVTLTVRKPDGRVREVSLDGETLAELGLRFSPMDFKRCRNKCVFCFVDQMPKGLRPSLYVKDEDVRLSFLFGNFTTLNDVTEAELQRILEQHLSPQYVSVHAVTPAVRERLFGRPMKRDILDTLRRLAEGGIEIHTQVVLCPGLNDGEELDRTIETLGSLHEEIRSLAVVPVGLTRHRRGLPEIRPYDAGEMNRVIDQVHRHRERFRATQGRAFVHLSDEWYLVTERPLPEAADYEGFPQLDNGVGMTRHFLDELEPDIEAGLPRDLSDRTVVTGRLGERVWRRYLFPRLVSAGVEALPELVVVDNRFFGPTVTVAGLLTAGDIAVALDARRSRGPVGLPPNLVNPEGLFLDGPDLPTFERTVGRPVAIADPLPEWLRRPGEVTR